MTKLAPAGLATTFLAALSPAALIPAAPLPAVGQTPAVAPDTVHITLSDPSGEPASAQVEQRLAGMESAYLIRLPGQRASLWSARSDPSATFDAVLPGAYRIDVPEGGRRVRYRVEGRLSRIPIFVPAGEGRITVAREEARTVIVRLQAPPGSLADVDLATSLPRFRREGEGALVAELSSLPSFVRLSRGGALSFARLIDLAVVVLIFLGAVWAWRKGRRLAGPSPRRARAGDGG